MEGMKVILDITGLDVFKGVLHILNHVVDTTKDEQTREFVINEWQKLNAKTAPK